MYVGDLNYNGTPNGIATANKLTVSGTGTASMASITVGYARQAAASSAANANELLVTGGGSLTTSGTNYIGRATIAGAVSNANTATVTGTGSTWNAGAQTIYVGHTNNATATSNNNILTVASGGALTNVSSLIVGFGTGTETGNQLVVNGSITVTTLTVSTGNTLSGSGTVNGAATVSGNLNPGSSPGLLTFGNSLALANTTVTTMEIDGTTLGVGFDAIDVGTSLTYDGALSLVLGATFGSGSYTFNLFDFTSQSGSLDSIALTGNYTGSLTNTLGVWSTTTNSGNETWTFTQSTGDLSLIVVPEPRAGLLGGLGLLMLLRRRRS
jgi:hypothetical protein